jgi:hypothetical protein
MPMLAGSSRPTADTSTAAGSIYPGVDGPDRYTVQLTGFAEFPAYDLVRNAPPHVPPPNTLARTTP